MSNKFLKLALAVSLLCNLLMLGMVSGHAGRDLLACNDHRHINLMEMGALLTPQALEPIKGKIVADQKDLDNLRQQLHDERLQAINTLGGKPFNKDAYDAHIKTIGEIHVKISQDVSDALAAIASQSDDAQRKKLVDTLTSRLSK